jgi:hypothetical protein
MTKYTIDREISFDTGRTYVMTKTYLETLRGGES